MNSATDFSGVHENGIRWSIIGDVRGLGGMQAIELVQSQESKAPASDETKKITQHCYEHGLITITAGTFSNVIRVLVHEFAARQIDGEAGCT